MDNLNRIARTGQQLLYFFRNKHGAVLASGTAKSDGQIALAFTYIVRQQINQERRNAVDELLRLGKRTDILRHLRMTSRIGPKRRNEMWIRQETHIKQQISII